MTLPFADYADTDDEDTRRPRGLDRLIALDDAIEALMLARLDRIDRRAPLPAATVAGVNTLLVRGRRVMARAPGELATAPFATDAAVMPGDAFGALLKLKEAVALAAEAVLRDDAAAPPIHSSGSWLG